MRDFDPTASEFISSGYLERSRPGGVLYDLGSVVGAVAGPLIGGIFGSDAAGDAADTQAAAADRATQLQKEMFDKQVELQAPFREAGLTANNRLMQLLGLAQGGAENGSLMQNFGMDQFQADPGYQFRMDEGMRALEGSAAARGGLLSGAAMKAIQKYGQGVASQEYGNAYNRYTADQTNQYNRLAGLVNTGMGATNQTSNAAANFANNASSNIIGAGNAAAAGQVGAANALVGGINSGINAYQNNQLMQMIQQPSPSLAGYTPTTNFNVAPANYSLY